MNEELEFLAGRPALQQPRWEDEARLAWVRDQLAASPGLVTSEQVLTLRALLALVSEGAAQVIQCGDCAEDPAECGPDDVARKAGVLDLLAGTLKMTTARPVLRVGRIAGQFAKPRSQQTEFLGEQELPVYRGHMVNGPEPDPHRRRPDPLRMLKGYRSAAETMVHLGWGAGARPVPEAPIWTSHEALLLDYELPMLRRTAEGELLLTSTHWPWIGERTRQLHGAHVAILSAVCNPIACKVGPGMTVAELLALCERLDPNRTPGRLTLIARMGAGAVAERLPLLLAGVRDAGHPVIWLCDPMHGNTVRRADGLKTRYVEAIVREVREFQSAVAAAGVTAGGLHLETTPDDVDECGREADPDRNGGKYNSLCDPRLNSTQAIKVVSAWRN